MVSIRRDRRHTAVNVAEIAEIGQRCFHDWSMAYAGPSTYVGRQIAPLLPVVQEAQSRQSAVNRIRVLMQEFVLKESPRS